MTNKIYGIYLAAGQSVRFGINKLHMPAGNTYLGCLALRTILQSNLKKVIVVTHNQTNPTWLKEKDLLNHDKIILVKCPDARKGQANSLKYGLKYAIQLGAEAVTVFLADQPFISLSMCNKLIHCYQKNKDLPFVASTYMGGFPRAPILFSKVMFKKLSKLHGDTGAKSIVRRQKKKGRLISFSNPKYFFDVDTMADYSHFQMYLQTP